MSTEKRDHQKTSERRRQAIFYVGGITYGLPVGLSVSVISTIREHGFSLQAFLSTTFLFTLFYFLAGFYIIGCFFGWIMSKLFLSQKAPK